MSVRSDWRADRARYGRMGWLVQPAYWTVATYRWGQWSKVAPRLLRPVVHATYFLAYLVSRSASGIDIPRGVSVGPGLLIHHFGGIIVNPRVSIGADCVLRHGVTIGSRHDDGPVPVIGDRVEFGAYAQVLGGVHVGDGATIGALSLVLHDVPAGATVAGIPARVL